MGVLLELQLEVLLKVLLEVLMKLVLQLVVLMEFEALEMERCKIENTIRDGGSTAL